MDIIDGKEQEQVIADSRIILNSEQRMEFLKRLAKIINDDKEPDSWNVFVTTVHPKRMVRDEAGNLYRAPRDYTDGEKPVMKQVITWMTGDTLNQFIFKRKTGRYDIIYRRIPPDPDGASDEETDDDFVSSRCSLVDVLHSLHNRLSILELGANIKIQQGASQA